MCVVYYSTIGQTCVRLYSHTRFLSSVVCLSFVLTLFFSSFRSYVGRVNLTSLRVERMCWKPYEWNENRHILFNSYVSLEQHRFRIFLFFFFQFWHSTTRAVCIIVENVIAYISGVLLSVHYESNVKAKKLTKIGWFVFGHIFHHHWVSEENEFLLEFLFWLYLILDINNIFPF